MPLLRSRCRRFGAFLALAFAFFCVQQGAIRHWALHAALAAEASASKAPATKAPATGDRCDECVALCAFAGAAPAAEPSNAFDAAARIAPRSLPVRAASVAPWLAFRSRAPPLPA